jgi:hypothetical protein
MRTVESTRQATTDSDCEAGRGPSVVAGEHAGFSVEQMIQLLRTGTSAKTLLF